MKNPLPLLALLLLAAVPAQAQLFRPSAARGAAIGGVAGAIIGHNQGRHGWEGAAYGAAAGAIIGSIVGNDHHRSDLRRPLTRYSHDRYRPGHRGWTHPRVVHRPGFPVMRVHPGYPRQGHPFFGHSRGRTIGTGVLLGGIGGGIIGHNHGRRGWEGAAYGAGTGALLANLAYRSATERAAIEYAAERRAQALVRQAVEPRQVTIINNYNYYGSAPATPMAPANGLFGR